MDEMSPTELRAWINDTYRAQRAAFIADVQQTPVEEVAADFDIGFGLAQRLQSALAGLNGTRTA
jgi:hypothetical protein